MLKRWFSIAAWNFGLLILVLILAELVFGSWFQAPGLWNLGVFRDVRWTIDTSDHYVRNGPITYSRDYYGLRGSFGTPEQANILALGGSTTDQRMVDDAETWPEVMAACLKERGAEARVANVGVAGQTTRGHAANFDLWLKHVPGLKPGLAIAHFGVNENEIERRGENDDVTRYFETKEALTVWHNLRNWIGMNSAVLRLHRIIKGNIKAYKAGLHPMAIDKAPAGKSGAQALDEKLAQARADGLALTSDKLARRKSEVEGKMALELASLTERLRVLKEAIEDFGATPVFVTQNSAIYRLGDGMIWGDVDNYVRMQALARTTMDFCQKRGMTCIDLAATLFYSDGDTYDGIHTTAQGARKVGEAICRQLDPATIRRK